MAKSILVAILGFYLLSLLQTSFLVHFTTPLKWVGWSPNFILILVILLNLYEKPEKNFGIFSAIIGGFFLDIFSERFFGFWVLILIGLSIFIKFLVKKYVRFPIPKIS